MSQFLTAQDFERAARNAGITDLFREPVSGEYSNAHTQRAFLVWESLAQSKHASAAPTAWLMRRNDKPQGISVPRPYANLSPSEWAAKAATGWQQPLALWPAMPITSDSENAILAERQRQLWVKGYHPTLDQRYQHRELMRAAICYLLDFFVDDKVHTAFLWPWPHMERKAETPLRAIEKATALLIAEHERLTVVAGAAQ